MSLRKDGQFDEEAGLVRSQDERGFFGSEWRDVTICWIPDLPSAGRLDRDLAAIRLIGHVDGDQDPTLVADEAVHHHPRPRRVELCRSGQLRNGGLARDNAAAALETIDDAPQPLQAISPIPEPRSP